jgi:hypothetical protein
VRNVGSNVEATYTPSVSVPAGVRVMVKPRKVRFPGFRATQKTRRSTRSPSWREVRGAWPRSTRSGPSRGATASTR